MKIRSSFMLLVLALASVAGSAHASDDLFIWRNVTPDEIQMKAPKVEPDADAEAIFWEVWVDDKKETSISYDHYVRVKIFTARGQEKFAKFDIPFAKGKKIEGIAARVIKPDGTIVDLNPNDVLEREIVRAGKIKVLAKSFAVPGIAPGVIVEYRYREVYKDTWGNGLRLEFQRDIPMQKIAFHIRPQKGYPLIQKFYNMDPIRFVEDPNEKGFFVASMESVPAYKVEPQMPPEDEVRRWAFVTYTVRYPSVVWHNLSERYGRWLADYAKPTDLITKKAAELTQGATTDDEKLRRIYEYVQKDIKNVTYDRSLTDDDRDRMDRKWDHAEDVIKARLGNSIYIELLFASLAKALGYEVGLAFSGDRSKSFFSPEKHPYTSFVHLACTAVKVGPTWRYYNPSVPYIPYGYLSWNEEGVTAILVGDTWGYETRNIPISNYDRSPAKRVGKFTLSAEGTLEGNVRLEYSGQQAISRRRDDYYTSESKRTESFQEDIKARMSTAEFTGVSIENFDDISKPLTYSYNVKIPGYAQRTGQRLFLQPGFFEYGAKPLFSSTARTHDIHFAYPWSEVDEIEIQLPKGFDPESTDPPSWVYDPKKIGNLRVMINYDKSTGILRYGREFHFGGGSNVLFPVAAYSALRSLFDLFHKSDSHIISLKAQK